MNSTLLNVLNLLKKNARMYDALGKEIPIAETLLAKTILAGNVAKMPALVSRASSFESFLVTIDAIQRKRYPLTSVSRKRKSKALSLDYRKKHAPDIAHKFLKLYSPDEEFDGFVRKSSQLIHDAIQSQNIPVEIYFPANWAYHKTMLAKRAILISLIDLWRKGNFEEPIFWKISDAIKVISGKSAILVNEAFMEIIREAGARRNMPQNEVETFIKKLNDDKSGNILDSLLLSQRTYQALLSEGWQPDRWEIENLPMSIEMLLAFLSKEDFTQIEQIDDVLEIGLSEANEKYRYRGSPFESAADKKKVKIIVPGWERKGALIIQPKVSEIS